MKSLRLILLQNCRAMTSPDTLGIISLQSPLQMRRCTARLWLSSISNGRMRTSYRWWKAKLYGCLTAMGMAYSTLEEWDNAVKYLNQSIPLAHSLNEPVLEGTALAVLAFTYTSANQYKKAIPSYEQALLILQNPIDNQQRALRGSVLTGLGMNYIQTGEHKKAFEYLEQALTLKRDLKDPAGEAQHPQSGRDRGGAHRARLPTWPHHR